MIETEFQNKDKNAKMLMNYLFQRRNEALIEETEEEDVLKKQGVLLGQHIPSLPTKLYLDKTVISQFSAQSLANASDLVRLNKTNKLRRTGNLPISEVFEELKIDRNKKKMNQITEVPSFQLKTQAVEVKEESIKARFAATIKENGFKGTNTKLQQMKKIFPKREAIMGAEERMANEDVLKSMNFKLNYKRNPHNNPETLSHILTKPHNTEKYSTNHHSPPQKISHSKSSIEETMLFLAEPSVIEFSSYEKSDVLKRSITFRNISTISRTLRVVQPNTKYFTISPLKYPTGCRAGSVAAGMHVYAEICFYPDSLGDYSDGILVETEGGSFRVPIIAHRQPPQLDIPSLLDIGVCLVGDAVHKVITCTNSGGPGSFCILSEDYSHDISQDIDRTLRSGGGCIRIPPFTIYPSEFTLGNTESIEINIEYVPLHLGNDSIKFNILCDNTQVRLFTLKGRSKQIDISIYDINEVIFDNKMNLETDLYFEGVITGGDRSQQFGISNDTGIPIEYEWVWMDTDVSEEDVYDTAKEILNMNEDIRESSGSTIFGPRLTSGRRESGSEIRVCTPFRNKEVQVMKLPLDNTMTPLNDIPQGDFTLSPARGVFPGEGTETFTATYCPQSLLNSSYRAVLVLRNIPLGAFPDERQFDELNSLSTYGHGPYPRLLSWISQLSTQVAVNYTALMINNQSNNGKNVDHLPEFSTNAVSFEVILNLVLNHYKAKNNDQYNENISEDEMEYENEKDRIFKVEIYNLNIKLKKLINFLMLFLNNDLDMTEISTDDKEIEYVTLYSWNGNEDMEVSILPTLPFNTKNEDTPDTGDNESGELSDEEKSLMSRIYMDMNDACTLYGDIINTFLNEKVQHEAIEFLQEKVYKIFAIFMFCSCLSKAGSI